MTQRLSEDERLKRALKEALREVLDERKDMLRDVVREALEDIAMTRAIEEGLKTTDASRGEVLSTLESGR